MNLRLLVGVGFCAVHLVSGSASPAAPAAERRIDTPGVLVDSSGHPLRNARLYVPNQVTEAVPGGVTTYWAWSSVVTDGDGRFTFSRAADSPTTNEYFREVRVLRSSCTERARFLKQHARRAAMPADSQRQHDGERMFQPSTRTTWSGPVFFAENLRENARICIPRAVNVGAGCSAEGAGFHVTPLSLVLHTTSPLRSPVSGVSVSWWNSCAILRRSA